MRKAFRIEQFSQLPYGEQSFTCANDVPSDISAKRHAEIMAALTSLRANGVSVSEGGASEDISAHLLAEMKRNMAEAQKLKDDIDNMLAAINETKSDIAALNVNALDNGSVNRVSNELDAIVFDTEAATNNLLNAVEVIDNNASLLIAGLKGDQQGLAADIQEQVTSMYEACNFQDLTGQRINKVIKLLRFIEDRVNHMVEIWGGIETFKSVVPAYSEKAVGDAALLNGPSLNTDDNVVNQDDIDALFA